METDACAKGHLAHLRGQAKKLTIIIEDRATHQGKGIVIGADVALFCGLVSWLGAYFTGIPLFALIT